MSWTEHHNDNYSWSKRPPECIKMHHFKGENTKLYLGRGRAPSPDPTPTGEGDTPFPDPTSVGASIPRTPSKPHFWLRACCGPPNQNFGWAIVHPAYTAVPSPMQKSTKLFYFSCHFITLFMKFVANLSHSTWKLIPLLYWMYVSVLCLVSACLTSQKLCWFFDCLLHLSITSSTNISEVNSATVCILIHCMHYPSCIPWTTWTIVNPALVLRNWSPQTPLRCPRRPI